jgi:hypothetical protein
LKYIEIEKYINVLHYISMYFKFSRLQMFTKVLIEISKTMNSFTVKSGMDF